MEASIVSVPNNKNAVKLMASGKLVEDNSLALKLSTENQKPHNMKNELLPIFEALSLQLKSTSTEAHAAEAINVLKAERDALKLKVEQAETKLKADAEAKVKALIDGAVESKKLKAEQKDHFLKLASADYESTKAIIDSMTPHLTISSQLVGGAGSGDSKSPFDGKTFKELMATAEGSKYLAKLKADKNPLHKTLWEASYPQGAYNG
jgi:hypothetical protein